MLKLNVNTTNVLIMKVLSNGVASDEKCIQTDVFIDIVLLNIKFYMSMVICKEILWREDTIVSLIPYFCRLVFGILVILVA